MARLVCVLRVIAVAAVLCPVTLRAEQLCDGRYANATQMLEAAYGKYGTLYSGGEHWHRRDNVGATIDIYRLLRGLPDQRFRDADRFTYSYADDPLPRYPQGIIMQDVVAAALPVIEGDDENPIAARDKYAVAVASDLATTLGPEPGWWLGDGHGLSDGEARTRALTQSAPFVAWLQMVQAASDAPWAYLWYLRYGDLGDPALAELAAHSAAIYAADGGIEWLLASAMLSPDGVVALSELSVEWQAAIDACEASDTVYAAHAMARYEVLRTGASLQARDRGYLSPVMYERAFRQSARRILLLDQGAGFRARAMRPLIDLALDERNLSWLNVARTYQSGSLEDLIAVHDGTPLDPVALRALNVLSVAHLLQFADAPGRSTEERRQIYLIAFARLIALDQPIEAEALVPQLGRLFPDHDKQLTAIAGRRWPLDVRLALSVLALPDASVWLTDIPGVETHTRDVGVWQRNRTKYGIDLPLEMRTGGFLQRDLEVWLQLPHRWDSYQGMRGYSVDMMDRAHVRRVRPTWSGRVPVLVARSPDRPLAFAALIAWDEIPNLGPRDGLSRRISLSLIRWAANSPDNGFLRSFGPQDEMAEGLRAVVLLARQNDMGDLDGTPVGQVAFELLHRKFPDSAAARATPFWWRCNARCER